MSTTIAVVDDEPHLREAVVEYLQAKGFTVVEAGDAVAFRALAETTAIDIVVLDVAMPGEDGLSLARWLRRRGDVGIIFATASGLPIDRIIGLELGADDYLVKPYDLRELLARVRSLVRRLEARPSVATGAVPVVARSSGRTIVFGSWQLDLDGRRLVDTSGRAADLTPLEFDPARDPRHPPQPGAVARPDRRTGARRHRRRRGRPPHRHPNHPTAQEDRTGTRSTALHPHGARRRLCLRHRWGLIEVRRRSVSERRNKRNTDGFARRHRETSMDDGDAGADRLPSLPPPEDFTMTPSDIAAIRADFAAVAGDADGFAARFYERLFEIDPSLRPLFPDDLSPQRKKLVQALAMVVAGLDRLETMVPTIAQLGRRHGGYGVEAHHYASVGEAILATLEERVEAFGDRNRAAWGKAYATLADVMITAANDAMAA